MRMRNSVINGQYVTFACERPPSASREWALGLQMIQLFGEVMEALRDRPQRQGQDKVYFIPKTHTAFSFSCSAKMQTS